MPLSFRFGEDALDAFGQLGPKILDSQLLVPRVSRIEPLQKLLLVSVKRVSFRQILRASSVLEQGLLLRLLGCRIGGLVFAPQLEPHVGNRQLAPSRLLGSF